jgi:hypothetical protein
MTRRFSSPSAREELQIRHFAGHQRSTLRKVALAYQRAFIDGRVCRGIAERLPDSFRLWLNAQPEMAV